MSMKIIFAILLLSGSIAMAQNTSVTATITDGDGQTWNNGSWTAQIFSPGGIPKVNGVPLTPSQLTLSGTMDGTGTLSGTFTSNTAVSPLGSVWRITICPDASANCSTGTFQISGSSMNLSSQLSAISKSPRFPAGPLQYGYLDGEVQPVPLPGGTYYNVTSGTLRLWNGSVWADIGTGNNVNKIIAGTGITISPVGGTGTVTVNNAGVLSLTAGTGISLSGSTGNITITNTGGGGGGLSGQTTNFLPLATSATASTTSSHVDDGSTTAGTVSVSEPFAVNATGNGINMTEGTPPTGIATIDIIYPNSTTHRLSFNNNNAGAFIIPGIAAAATSGHFAAFASNGIDLVDGGTGTGGGLSGQTVNFIPLATSATASTTSSHIDDGATTAATVTVSEPLAVTAAGNGIQIVETSAPSGIASSDIIYSNSTTHHMSLNNNNAGGVSIVGIATAAIAGHPAAFASNGIDLVDGGIVKLNTYIVSGLPSASTAGAGAIVIVTDSLSSTPGNACAGGGYTTMIAVSNGTTWSCH